jgi:hypothetical protein
MIGNDNAYFLSFPTGFIPSHDGAAPETDLRVKAVA